MLETDTKMQITSFAQGSYFGDRELLASDVYIYIYIYIYVYIYRFKGLQGAPWQWQRKKLNYWELIRKLFYRH